MKKKCPFLKKTCLRERCELFIKLRGQDPQNGGAIDEGRCSIAWGPILAIENAKEVRQGAAATEGFRNDMVKMQAPMLAALASEVKLLEPN